MNFSYEDQNQSTVSDEMKNKINMSLPTQIEQNCLFETINEVFVPVNKILNLENTRFQNKERIYKNPNLIEQASRSIIIDHKNFSKEKKNNINSYKEPPKIKTTRVNIYPFDIEVEKLYFY